MHRSSLAAPLVALFILFPFALFADEKSPSPSDAIMLDAVVVTAEGTEISFQTGDVDLEQTPAFHTVITRDAFEGKVESLSEVLEKEAGIQVRRSGGLGSFSSVSLRGSSSEQVMVFMDGVLLNDASGGGVDLSNIALADVAAIEVFRGVTPVNFGKASVGGVVNIKTRRAREGLEASVSAGAGSFDTYTASAFLNHKPGKWDYLLSADYMVSENDFEFLNDKGTSFNPDDDVVEERINAGFDRTNLLAKLGYDLSETARLDLVNQFFNKNQELPDWRNTPGTRTAFDTLRNITTLKLTADEVTPLHLNTAAQLIWSWKEEAYDDRLGQIGLGRQHTRDTTTRFGGNLFAEWLADANTLSLMLDYQHEEYEPEERLNPRTPSDSARDYLSAGVQNTFLLFDARLGITPALRYTWIDDELKSTVGAHGATLAEISRTEDDFSPQVGVKFQPNEWLTVRSNLAKYVREPSFFELFGDRGFFLGNPELAAEEGVNFDIGFAVNHRFETPWLSRLSAEIAYFHGDVENLISRSFDARGVGKSVNIAESEIYGWETELRADLLHYFRLIGNATWQETENQSPIGAFDGKQLPGRFARSYLARLEGIFGSVRIWAEYLRDENMYYDTANLLPAEDKETMNLGASWLFRDLLLTFEARNIQDNQYEDFNGFPMPGDAYYVTAKYSW